MEEIAVKTPFSEGRIYIGNGASERRLPALAEGQRNFVVTDDNVFRLYRDFFGKYFGGADVFVLPAGEEHKTFANLGAILERMTRAGLHRSSRLFAVGGGVVGDIGGLAASLYMRGISCVQVPTTLLAQADSGVGGKTAVDLCGVKNVVGSFYQPCEVVADISFLSTLPLREIKCGLGELVKYAALNGEIFDIFKENADKMSVLGFLASLLAPCVRHKARVTEADERETGERKSLNVGHTTGHALELDSGMSHGESVLWGMLFETCLAQELGVCDMAYGEELKGIVRSALKTEPVFSPDFSDIGRLAAKALADKKNSDDGKVCMAVAESKGKWTLLSLPFEEYKEGLERLAESFQRENEGGRYENN